MDAETIPFQVNLGYQVPRTKVGDYPVGYLTSPWYFPELETNIAMAYVPIACPRSAPPSESGCPTDTPTRRASRSRPRWSTCRSGSR
jgi:glycine cleavage system aminomethyltransferase T